MSAAKLETSVATARVACAIQLLRLTPLCLILTVCAPVARGQSHTIFHFSVPEGLPSSEVYEVYEDKTGFLWFATDNGVARYDGNEFQVFDVKDGLTDPVVFGFFEDDLGRIWFRTFSGRLSYFDGEKIHPYPFNAQLLKSGDYSMFNFQYDSKSEELWFTMAHVFGKIDAKGNVETKIYDRGSLFIEWMDGKLLHGNDLKYAVKEMIIDGKRFPVALSDTTESKFYNTISAGDKVYISVFKDLFLYERETLRKILSANDPIISLSTDRANDLWIGYLNHGVEKLTGPNRGWRPEFLQKKSVTKVLQDAASGFWFTTLESGVYNLPNLEIENFPLPTQSRLKTVWALKDTVLLGDQAGNLLFMDARTARVLARKKLRGEVYAIFQDDSKNVWVSAGLDILRFGPDFSMKNRYRRLIATSFSKGSDGRVWAHGGIRMTSFNRDGRLLKSQARYAIYRAMLVNDSIIYVAGRTGLHTRNLDMEFLNEFQGLAGTKINQIESLNDSVLLLATQGNGLVLLNKNGNHRQLDTRHQFVADNVYCFSKTDSTLWLGTEKGLVALALAPLERNDYRFNRVSYEAGITSNKINFILPVKEKIWVFADEGLSILPKSLAKPSALTPVFYLKKLTIGTDTLSSFDALRAKPVTLPYHKNNLSFSFGYISFANQDLFMRYRVSPETDWILTKERIVQFSSMAPDVYAFELQYAHDNIHWTPAFQPIPFTIDAPWWMKWYTQAGGLAFIILLGYLYLRHRQSIYKQKAHYLGIINRHQQKLIQSEIETLERERKRIARELHDGVGTNLTAIKLMVNQLLKQHGEPRARDIEEQFQFAIKELKDIIYGLTPPSLRRYGLFAALRNYIAKLNDTLTSRISLQVFGKEIDNYEFNIMVFRIVQELISNSIKHSSAKHITIHLNAFAEMFNIVYEDDGVGFSHDSRQGGLGLDNIESRIQSINGTIKFDSGNHGVSYTIDIPLQSIREPV
ncbi:MAG TPA: two-component regulator propeller domain-containing protein [Chryseosolibacter sp.]